MQRSARLALILVVLISLLGSLNTSATRAAAASPADQAKTLDDSLFSIQAAMLGGATSEIAKDLSDAQAAAAGLIALVPSNVGTLPDLTVTLGQIKTAISANDQLEVSRLRGVMHGQSLEIGYLATVAAASAGDAESARAWLIVRIFTQSTRLARPNADSTLALQSLTAGTLDPAAATEIVSADLLDTYQGEIDRQLDKLESTISSGDMSNAESIGLIQALWPLMEQPYGQQLGAESLASLQAQVAALSLKSIAADPTVLTPIDAAFGTFRAAPLSTEEQSGRARQLILYMGLVPVEYARGVKNGEVLSTIEVQEASTFLAGARAAFADLRPSLNKADPATTQSLADQLDALTALVNGTLQQISIAEADAIRTATSSIESSFRDVVPGDWLRAGGDADFDVVISLLEQMEAAVAAGQYSQAESARLEAYAIFDAGAEKRLLAFAPKLAQQIELGFWGGTNGKPGLAYLIANKAAVGEVTKVRTGLVKSLSEARQRLGSGSTARGAIIFNSASIVFREGLEAVLILASLLASMTGENRRLKRPMALGSALALVATIALFILARTVLLSLSQYSERVEAVVSVVAIGVLLLVMNWFFHKVYWTKWIAKHHKRRRVIIGGMASQAFGLVVLGFTSVFREGAETVLFLQALVLDAGTQVVIEGTALGLLATGIVGYLMFALQAKLPHKKMLIVTGFMISLVLVMMVGKTVHVLQAVGWAPIHPVGNTAPPYWMSLWLGVFNTWEGILGQLIAMIFVFGSYFAAERSHDRSQREMLARAQAMPTAMAGD